MEEKNIIRDNIQNDAKLRNYINSQAIIIRFVKSQFISLEEIKSFSREVQIKYMEQFETEQSLELAEFIDGLLTKSLYEKIQLHYDEEIDRNYTFYFEVFQFISVSHFECEFELESQIFNMAKQHLLKVSQFKTARDKFITINNACKSLSIFLQKTKKKQQGADDFLPLLIYTILQAKPTNPWSDLQFTKDFIQPLRNIGLEQYYFTAFESALEFIEQIDKTKIKIDPVEYDKLYKENYDIAKEKLDYEPKVNEEKQEQPQDLKKQNQQLVKWVKDFGDEFQAVFGEDGLSYCSFYQKDLGSLKICELKQMFTEYQLMVSQIAYFKKKIESISELSDDYGIQESSLKKKLLGMLKFN